MHVYRYKSFYVSYFLDSVILSTCKMALLDKKSIHLDVFDNIKPSRANLESPLFSKFTCIIFAYES